jgi:hypothetical protein
MESKDHLVDVYGLSLSTLSGVADDLSLAGAKQEIVDLIYDTVSKIRSELEILR